MWLHARPVWNLDRSCEQPAVRVYHWPAVLIVDKVHRPPIAGEHRVAVAVDEVLAKRMSVGPLDRRAVAVHEDP